ncbi:acetyl-CoA carboxylase biotin carboxylase subunit family protein [Marinobacter sp.]|uniref:ATP-grasp domain-containing protein n=1 Tax=Marinobacter sp. TaxID=50741 RepID=UPI00384DF207
MKNIFVIGMEPFNQELLETLNEPQEQYRFLPLFGYEEVVEPANFGYPSIKHLIQRARDERDRLDGTLDAVMGYWDFPTSALVPLIARDLGLPGPSPESVARCEHKYYSRVEQKKVVPEMVPGFQSVNPFAEDPLGDLVVDYPFWLKPIKAHSSFLGYHIDGPERFRKALVKVREHIGFFAQPFNEFLDEIDLPEEIRAVDGYHCIAEEIVSADYQFTLEGYCWEDKIEIFGIVDSIREGQHHSSFSRYQYPSKLPQKILDRTIEAAGKIMRHIEYQNGCFNIEFFWNPGSDRLYILEINSRISKSHSPLFLMVDGAPNLQVPLELALGREPDFPHRQGEYPLSGKFMLRYHEDGFVERAPTEADIVKLRERFPEARVVLYARQGMQLSDLALQDSYSFEAAVIFLGASGQEELEHKFETAKEILNFQIRPLKREEREEA